MRRYLVLLLLFGVCCATIKANPPLPTAATASHASIDMRGKRITTYLLYNAEQRLKSMANGEVLEIVADTYEPIDNDIKAWSRMTGRILVGSEDRTLYGDTIYKKASLTFKRRKWQQKLGGL